MVVNTTSRKVSLVSRVIPTYLVHDAKLDRLVSLYSLSRNNRFYQPGSDRSVPTSLRAPGSPVPTQVEGQRQRRGE